MPNETSLYPAALNGRPASAADLIPLAFAGFAHFTAIQVRDCKIRGLDLHLKRLSNASLSFFGRALPDEELRAHIKQAIDAGPADQSLTVTIFSPDGEFTADSIQGDLAVLVRSGPPSNGPKGPLRLAVIEHERPHPRSSTSANPARPITCIRRSGRVSTTPPSWTGMVASAKPASGTSSSGTARRSSGPGPTC